MRVIFIALVLAFVFVIDAPVAAAAQVLPVNIDQLAKADVAFTGVCREAKAQIIMPEKAPAGLLVTTYTFDILPDGALKGDVGEAFTFSQWGASREESARLGMPYVFGVPQYEVGKVYTVFLTAETGLNLRAPIGLGHGKFNMIEGADGNFKVMNEYGNRNLFDGLPQTKVISKALSAAGISNSTPPRGPIDYSRFVGLIRGLQKGE